MKLIFEKSVPGRGQQYLPAQLYKPIPSNKCLNVYLLLVCISSLTLIKINKGKFHHLLKK